MSTSFVGRVLSNRMDKSVVVAVQRIYKHPRFEKIVKKTKKFMAHDEANECNIGDVVKIVSTRPISKRKAFSVEEVVHRAFVFGDGAPGKAG